MGRSCKTSVANGRAMEAKLGEGEVLGPDVCMHPGIGLVDQADLVSIAGLLTAMLSTSSCFMAEVLTVLRDKATQLVLSS